MSHLRLKGEQLLGLGKGAENVYQLALQARQGYPTVRRYVLTNQGRIDLDILNGILSEGLGLSEEQILELKFKDLFEFI